MIPGPFPRSRSRRWVPLVIPLIVAGCATTEDPHEGGFVSGVVGLTSGGYQERIREREQRYEQELTEQQRLMAEGEDLRRERALIRADLKRANKRLAALDRKLAREQALLAGERGSTASARARVQRLETAEARRGALANKLQAAQRGDSAVTDFRAQSRDIDRDLDELDSMVQLMGGGGI